ncbi:MAG: pyridoxal phosphate-dependent aminotransferase [Candidatus Aminicenantes bacterium]|nr:pyridoxal phosphate-dependent aminotransferase [Candidatus Aminicenantes bacterium]
MKKPKGSLISYFSGMVTMGGGINLAQGKPGFSPPQELLDILREKIDDPALHQYAPGNGDFELLELLAKKLSQYTTSDTGNLLIVQGATEGISLSFLYLTTILKKPYSVLSFDPVYESYPKLPEIFDIPFVYFDMEANLAVDFTKLERVINEKKVMIVFIASPGNPSGKAWTRDEMKALVNLSKKYGFYILFDAVYEDIYFDHVPFNPLTFNYEKLFFINSFSKMLSITGWRIGYIFTHKDHMVNLRDIHDYTGLSAVPIFQRAIFEYLNRSNFGKGYIECAREKCKSSFAFMKKTLEESGFSTAEIHGGYFLWARLPAGREDAFTFALDLYKKVKVGVVPGENFSLTKKNYIRLNIAQEMATIRDAAERIKKFF